MSRFDGEDTYHPDPSNRVYHEWGRKNIDNYLLVPDAWMHAVSDAIGESEDSVFFAPYRSVIESFFLGQNLQLPPGSSWRELNANIFKVVDGKKILFEEKDSLFHQIASMDDNHLKINRQRIAKNMKAEELHKDIVAFFDMLEGIVA